jgi:para-nitrobenzyl esterase
VKPVAHQAAMEAGMLKNSRACAELRAKHGLKSASYIAAFMRKHPYAPGVKIADQNPATIGAYHTADVPYWFDTLDKYNWQRPTRVWTDWDRRLSDQMARALIAMAETGSPSTPAMPWPAWSAARPSYLVLGDTASPAPLHVKRMDWVAAHPAQPIAAATPARTGPRD